MKIRLLYTEFCVEALKQAFNSYDVPEIFNTDHGAQFTSNQFTDVLKSSKVAISKDGRGRCHDTIFIDRLWWTVKHQYLYLHSFDTGSQLRAGFKYWFEFYNKERSHQALANRTPNEVYFDLDRQFVNAA